MKRLLMLLLVLLGLVGGCFNIQVPEVPRFRARGQTTPNQAEGEAEAGPGNEAPAESR